VGSIRKASDQEYWTAVQRIWTFENPSGRWARLCKSAAKIAPLTYIATRNDKQSISRDELFHEIYSASDTSAFLTSILYSICFALAEIERYDEGAFQYCLQNDIRAGKNSPPGGFVQKTMAAGEIEPDFVKVPLHIKGLLQQLISEKKLSNLQSSFLEHCAWTSPDWTRLLGIGPWGDDSRVEFIRSIMQDPLNSPLYRITGDTAGSTLIDHFFKFEGVFRKTELAMRNLLPSGFLPKRVLLVEGATEQILLPHFAACISTDWKARAVLIIPAGGANQVVKRYPALRAQLKLPIDCLLDGDVSSQAQLLANQLSAGDRLYVLQSEAIEEAFPRAQIVDLVNAYFDTSGVGPIFTPVTLQELDSTTNQESMEKLWRKRNRGSFDKIGFAKVVAESITTAGQIPAEIRNLINDLCAY
jgi:hypothetical protein